MSRRTIKAVANRAAKARESAPAVEQPTYRRQTEEEFRQVVERLNERDGLNVAPQSQEVER